MRSEEAETQTERQKGREEETCGGRGERCKGTKVTEGAQGKSRTEERQRGEGRDETTSSLQRG
eukprot:748485-Hanusia_phi.AAC.4